MKDSTIQDKILRSRRGDQDSFRAVMLKYQPYAFRIAFRLLCDEDEANDVVQESFIKIWSHFAQYDPEQQFTTWIYTIVSNLCLDRLRARGRRRTWFVRRVSDEDPPGAIREPGPDEKYSNEELGCLIGKLSARLSPKQRLVFTLRDLEDLPVDEVVAITGLSPQAIKANLWNARRAIRGILNSEFTTPGISP